MSALVALLPAAMTATSATAATAATVGTAAAADAAWASFLAGSGSALAANTAATAAIASGATAAAGSSLLGTLSTGLTLASGAFSLFGGINKARNDAANLKLQAGDQLLQAKTEQVQGEQNANAIMDNLVQTLAAQRLSFAANGVDTSFGTPVSIMNNAAALADRQLATNNANTNLAILSRRRQAAALSSQSGMAMADGLVSAAAGAGGSLASLVDRRINRG